MLRHACGYKLANYDHDTRAIQAYLGHRNIQNTTRYTALAPQRFKEFFEIDEGTGPFCRLRLSSIGDGRSVQSTRRGERPAQKKPGQR
jgi:Phage integrase family